MSAIQQVIPTTICEPRRRFPAPSWGWPSSSRDLLLRAALLSDADEARTALLQWLARNDLDDVTFADHRLMAAISERHGSSLADLPEYPRMKGLQRQLWTQSRIRINAALPMLKALDAAGVQIMLLKGAARIALDPDAQRQRAQHDVDILVRPEQTARAAQMLISAGWQAGNNDSVPMVATRIQTTRATNFIHLPWGDVDLHRCAYHEGQIDAALDAKMWSDAEPACFYGLPVLVPCAAERLALCLSHGVNFPESHSDWVVDAADIIASSTVDWNRAFEIFTGRRMVVQAQIGLSYLISELGTELPPEAREMMAALRPERGLKRVGTLLRARPEEELRGWQRALRRIWITRSGSGRRKVERTVIPGRVVSIARAMRQETPSDASLSTTATLHPEAIVQRATPGPVNFSAEVVFETPSLPRRIEFELNSQTRVLARFRVLTWQKTGGLLRARLRARVLFSDDCGALTLEARPGKFILPHDDAAKIRKHRATPFYLVTSRWSCQRNLA